MRANSVSSEFLLHWFFISCAIDHTCLEIRKNLASFTKVRRMTHRGIKTCCGENTWRKKRAKWKSIWKKWSLPPSRSMLELRKWKWVSPERWFQIYQHHRRPSLIHLFRVLLKLLTIDATAKAAEAAAEAVARHGPALLDLRVLPFDPRVLLNIVSWNTKWINAL